MSHAHPFKSSVRRRCRVACGIHITARLPSVPVGKPSVLLAVPIHAKRYTYKLLAYMHEVPDLDCKAGNGIPRLDRYDQLAGYLLGAHCYCYCYVLHDGLVWRPRTEKA